MTLEDEEGAFVGGNQTFSSHLRNFCYLKDSVAAKPNVEIETYWYSHFILKVKYLANSPVLLCVKTVQQMCCESG